MKEIIVTTQEELDALPEGFTEYTVILIKNTKGTLVLSKNRENSSAVLRGNSSAELWENSSAELWGNSSAVLRENSFAVLRGNSSAELWENSSAVLRGNSVARILSNSLKKVTLYGFAVAFIAATNPFKIETKSVNAHIQVFKDLSWFETNAVEKTPTVLLYKRVSQDLKTQENSKKETVWTLGSTLTVPNWNPISECGEGKFHACSRPYFCDEFRSTKGDRYIAVEVKLEDLHEWTDTPRYPHKIAFRSGTVLYECDKFGNKVEEGVSK